MYQTHFDITRKFTQISEQLRRIVLYFYVSTKITNNIPMTFVQKQLISLKKNFENHLSNLNDKHKLVYFGSCKL